MKKIYFITILLFSPSPAFSQMAVLDVNNLAQTTTLVEKATETVKVSQEVLDKATEQLATVKKTSAQIGNLVSLGNSAVQWLKTDTDEAKRCLIPTIGQFMPSMNIKTTSLCDSQEFLRKELGIPTTADISEELKNGKGQLQNWGVGDWRKTDIIKYNSNGEPYINLPPKVIQEKRAKRLQFANDSRQSAIAVSYSYLRDKHETMLDGLDSLSNSLSGKQHSTNELLLNISNTLLAIYKAQLDTNALLASQIQMQASDSLEKSGILISQ